MADFYSLYSPPTRIIIPIGHSNQTVTVEEKLPPGKWLVWAMLHPSNNFGGANFWLDPQPAGFLGNLGTSMFAAQPASMTVQSPVTAADLTEETELVFRMVTMNPGAQELSGILWAQGVRLA